MSRAGNDSDTIFAPATAPGRAGVAVVRISGARANEVLEALAGALPEPRRACVRHLRRSDGAVIDEALVLRFVGPASFTGEDVAEFHVHGGGAVMAALGDALTALGARPAEPGEFSRRAFANGKLDLTQAEAIADLVDADTEGQRLQALRQLRGDLGALYDGWRSRLLDLLARVEAEIDFPDEGDVPGGLAASAGRAVSDLRADIAAHLDDGRRGERVRDGYDVVLIGPPNAGKSTLLNRLAGRDAAIVTDIPGTTRDVVEVRLMLSGFHVNLSDTAGLRKSADVVEREGVRRATARASVGDLRIGVVDAAEPDGVKTAAAVLAEGDVIWINKTDCADAAAARDAVRRAFHMNPGFHVNQLSGSAETGDGVEALIAFIESRVREVLGSAEAVSLTRARHRRAVSRAAEALDRAVMRLADAPELAGEDLRTAAHALGEVTGRVDVEEVLDRIFADFCIGK